MKKKIQTVLKKVLVICILFPAVLMINSCREEFSEKDALEILSRVDAVFYIFDKSSSDYLPVENATITVIQGTQETELVTNESGMATFPNLKLGTIFYRVEASNYLSYSGNQSLYNEGGLIDQQTISIGLFNLSDESLATVKGRVLIDTDLTNDDTEFAVNVSLNLRVQVDQQYLDFSATTDSEGRYEFKVPAETYGSYTIMRIPDLEISQKIAYNRIAGDERQFPDILPQLEDVLTIFSTNTSSNRNHNNYPVESVIPYYAIAEPAPKPENTAIISSVYTDGQGQIAGLNFSYGGDYSGDADNRVRVNVISMGQGQGAYFDFVIGPEFTSLQDIYFYGNYVLQPGSGYPDEEYYYNRIPYRAPTPQTGDAREKYLGNIVPGSTTIVNIDYGTGVYRLYDYD